MIRREKDVKDVKGHAQDLISSISGADREPWNEKLRGTKGAYFKKELDALQELHEKKVMAEG